MIVFNKIMEYSSLENVCRIDDKSYLFFGKAIDDRGEKVINFLKTKYDNYIKAEYETKNDSFLIEYSIGESKKIQRIDFRSFISELIINNDVKSIVLESTTLGYSEILLLLYDLNELKMLKNIKVFYAEPLEYTSKENEEYELSEEYSNHKYIKPFVLSNPHDSIQDDSATLVSLVGFEENRMGRVLNDSENKYNQLISIFPIPGFKFGWENISLSKHHIFLENREDIYYAPADNPYETYKILNKIASNLSDKRIIILPIGTKPHSIGAAVFLVNKKEKQKESKVATKYDFPIKKIGRSKGIDKIYEYILSIV